MTTLADPITLPCGVVLKNRMVKGAMTEGLADVHNNATQGHVKLYERWANSGAAVLLTGNVQIERNHLERPGNVVIEEGRTDLDALRAYAAAGTKNGTHLWMQISNAGRQTPKAVNENPMAPSAVALNTAVEMSGAPREMTEAEIEDMISRFAFVSKTAKDTGFTGVQIHAAHGYLLSEFLSPLANKRTDKWGGSIENRARFLIEAVKAARAAVGPEFPISVKLNSSDFQKGGFSMKDCLAVVELLNAAGLDLLEISGGNYEQPAMMNGEGELEPEYTEAVKDSTKAREGFFLNYARAVKKIANMPVLVTGGFRSTEGMNAALEDGGADMIGIGRPFCVEPELAKDVIAGTSTGWPRYEQTMRIGPGIFGPASPFNIIRMLNVLGPQGWYCMRILDMGGKVPFGPKKGVISGMIGYQKHEGQAAKDLAAARAAEG